MKHDKKKKKTIQNRNLEELSRGWLLSELQGFGAAIPWHRFVFFLFKQKTNNKNGELGDFLWVKITKIYKNG